MIDLAIILTCSVSTAPGVILTSFANGSGDDGIYLMLVSGLKGMAAAAPAGRAVVDGTLSRHVRIGICFFRWNYISLASLKLGNQEMH